MFQIWDSFVWVCGALVIAEPETSEREATRIKLASVFTDFRKGRRHSGAKEVSMATFFLQDLKYDLEIHLEDGLNDYPERYCLKRHLISPC